MSLKYALLTASVCTMFITGPSHAQLRLNAGSTSDPLTGLPGDQWVTMMTTAINGSAVMGKPEVFMLNATGQPLNVVTCDGKWQLVGSKPYIKDAPRGLPAWKATLVQTESFDGYCKDGVMAMSDTGMLYKGALVSTDNTFSNATFITFRVPR